MAFTQLTPQIPLRTDMGDGQAVAVIDYSEEHDLMWVVVMDDTGEIWTLPNHRVRAFKNITSGRMLVQDTLKQQPRKTYISDEFAKTWLEAPGNCATVLNMSLTPDDVRAAAARIEAGQIVEQRPSWMPDFRDGIPK